MLLYVISKYAAIQVLKPQHKDKHFSSSHATNKFRKAVYLTENLPIKQVSIAIYTCYGQIADRIQVILGEFSLVFLSLDTKTEIPLSNYTILSRTFSYGGRFASSGAPDSYAGGSSDSWLFHPYQTSQSVKARRSVVLGNPGWVFGLGLTTPLRRKFLLRNLGGDQTRTGLWSQ